jgi:hypothetical protein
MSAIWEFEGVTSGCWLDVLRACWKIGTGFVLLPK